MPDLTVANRPTRLLNLGVLAAAIAVVSIYPSRKEIWYDEVVSIQISRGISFDTPAAFSGQDTIRSSTLRGLDNVSNVYKATVRDNGNSPLYNLGLHWVTAAFGNSLGTYVAFSRLWSVATLLAAYAFANLLFGATIFTGLAIALLATDVNFVGMSYEIRSYSMGMFLVTLAGFYSYKFAYVEERSRHLALAALCSAGALLTHYLSAYVVLVLLVHLGLTKRSKLVSPKYAAAILAPAAVVALHVYVSARGLALIGVEDEARRHAIGGSFAVSEVARRTARLMALDFKVVLPAFTTSLAVLAASVLLLAGIYAASLALAEQRSDRAHLHMLFVLGVSASAFLALTTLISRHYAALYPRYHSFAVPFGSLFAAYALRVVLTAPRVPTIVRGGVLGAIVVPSCALYVLTLSSYDPVRRYNHAAVAEAIRAGGVAALGVPEWKHAFLVHSFLPRSHRLEYVRHGRGPYFTLRGPDSVRTVPVVSGH